MNDAMVRSYGQETRLNLAQGSAPADPTGVPLGPFANWAALPVSAETGALATVTSIGPGNATGTAIWSGSEWGLYRGIFDSVADLTAFAEPIQVGGVGSVEASGDNNENQVVYVYDGAAWARTAALSGGYAWALSSQWDFSAVGLRDGDFGIWAPENSAPIILRHKSACSFAGGGTRPAWMTPLAYAGTPVLQMWTDGTESNVTLAAQGWTIVNDAGCSVTATGGFQRLASPATATAARMQGMVGTVAAGTRVEAIFEARAETSNTSTLALPCMVADGTNGTYFGQAGTLGNGFKDAVFGGPLQTPTRNSATPQMPTLAQDAAVFIVRDEGRTVFDSATIGGLPFANYRRDAQLELFGRNLIQVTAQGQVLSGGATATLDFRGQVLTY